MKSAKKHSLHRTKKLFIFSSGSCSFFYNSYWINYSFIDKDAKQVANLFSLFSNNIFTNRGIIQIDVTINNLILGQGIYNIGVALNQVREDGSRGEIYMYDSNIASIQVVGIPTGHAPIQFLGTWNETKIVNG